MMMFKILKRKHLKEHIDQAIHIKGLVMPTQGWIKTMRAYYGMSVSALAKRVGFAQSRVSSIEEGELQKRITLETLNRLAGALNCDLVYAFVPKEDPDLFLQRLAETKAHEIVARLNTTMILEDQGISQEELKRHHVAITKDLLENPKKLWKPHKPNVITGAPLS